MRLVTYSEMCSIKKMNGQMDRSMITEIAEKINCRILELGILVFKRILLTAFLNV
jgi:hypothetical protein